MKRLDKIVLTYSAGPFAASFGVALFILVMQYIWLYLDEIAGKGVNPVILFEFVGYLSVSTFPLALPVAVLTASVMVMGGLAERNELAAMTSAGVPLLRVMRALVFAAAGVAVFSYLCSDYIIPVTTLKFKTRLGDIQRQKPALLLEEDIFNEDFRQFVIRIGDKKPDNETIREVMIQDQTNTGRLRTNQILADSGQMFTSADRRFFVMHLFDGTQYQEPGAQGKANHRYPFVRTHFRSWRKVWDLREFDMNRADESRYKTHRTMLSMRQLRRNLDSLQSTMHSGQQAIADDMTANLKRPPLPAGSPRADQGPVAPPLPRQLPTPTAAPSHSWLETFVPADRPALLQVAWTESKLHKTALVRRIRALESLQKEAVKSGYELYSKYSYALACFVFLFVGAPMGALIRKGGFGYPLLVSIAFFVSFIMLHALFKKLAELYWLAPFWAAMAPCMILMGIGAILTRRVMM